MEKKSSFKSFVFGFVAASLCWSLAFNYYHLNLSPAVEYTADQKAQMDALVNSLNKKGGK